MEPEYLISPQLCLGVRGTCGCSRGGGQQRPTRGEKLALVTVLGYKEITKSMGTERGNRELEAPRWEQKLMFMVCAFSEGRLGLSGSSAENRAMRGADLLALQWCLATDARAEKTVLPCEEKCRGKALLSTLKEAFFFFFFW